MGFMRNFMTRIQRIETLAAEQGALVDQEYETKKRMVSKQVEIDTELTALRQSAMYREAVEKSRGTS